MSARRAAAIQREIADLDAQKLEIDARRLELSRELADELAREEVPKRRRPTKPVVLRSVTEEEITDVEAKMARNMRRTS